MKTSQVLTFSLTLFLASLSSFVFAKELLPDNDVSLKMPKRLKFSGENIPVMVSPNGASVAKYYTANLADGKKVDCEVYLKDQFIPKWMGKSHFKKLSKHGEFKLPETDSKKLWKSVAKEKLTIAKVTLVMVDGDARKPAGLKPNYKIAVTGSKSVSGLACHLERAVSGPARNKASGSDYQWNSDDYLTADVFEKVFGSAQ